MRIAVEGCAHGELEIIYDAISRLEEIEGKKIDLLICCGDFQSTRNLNDLHCMAVPDKYKDMCTFYKYYSGEKIAPVLTIFIGGNHEASNYLQELPYGGWAAPNIYYLGYAGVVNVGGIRIAGISGIYKSHNWMQGHYERPPYTDKTLRSVYHTRNLEIFRLKQLSGSIHIFLSHDWPNGITKYGDVDTLLRNKPHFRQDIENNVLGSQPCMELLQCHYPTYWFSAHLHCKFAALVPEEKGTRLTKFLALDKCLPKRKFLQVVEIEHDDSAPIKLCYDLEWLTILFLTNHLLSVKPGLHYMPGPAGNGRWIYTPSVEEKENVLKKFNHDLNIPLNFKPTVEPYKPECPNTPAKNSLKLQINPQTTEFCNTLRIDDPSVLLQMVKGNLVESKSEIEDEESRHVDTPCTRYESGDISCTSLEESSENITLSEFGDSPEAIDSEESCIVPSVLNDSSLTAAQEESTDTNVSKDDQSEISITVLGPVKLAELGRILTHEHFALDFTGFYVPPPVHLNNYFKEKITLQNVGLVKQYPYGSMYNVTFNDTDTRNAILSDVSLLNKFGGGTIIENTSHGILRDIPFMKHVSQETGIHVVAGTGYYVASTQTESTLGTSVEQMYDLMLKELTVECNGAPGVKTGFIGEVGSTWPIHDFEKKAIRATGEVQAQLGCPVSFHPGRDWKAPFEIIRLYLEAGGAAEKAIMSHLDRTLLNDEDLLEFSKSGCYCQFDLFGVECSHYQLHPPTDMPSDAQRLDKIKLLQNEGRIDRVLLSHDIHTKHRLMAFGGHGFSHIYNNVLPKMLIKGFSQEDIDLITMKNPTRWLSP